MSIVLRNSDNAVAAGPAPAGSAPLVVIYNPAAGRRRGAVLDRVLAALAARGATPAIRRTAGPGDARRLAREAAAGGATTIAVAGGDGTLNEAINGLAEIPGGAARLALIPLGTANVLAAELGMTGAPEAVAAAIAGDAVRRIRLGEIAGAWGTRRFAMMAGVGFDARVVANVSLPLKRATGKFAYAWQTLREWRRHRPRRFRIVADGDACEAYSAILAKGHFYGGRFVAAPRASLDADSLELVLFGRGGRLAVLGYALALGLGRLHRCRSVRIVTARDIAIDFAAGGNAAADDAALVHADGEIVGRLPVRFTIAAAPLAVAAGPRADAAAG